MSVQKFPRTTPNTQEYVPFSSSESLWFWFMEARHSGARIKRGAGGVERACEPLDIYTIVQRLYRKRMLLVEHLRVLYHYGRRQCPPDPRQKREIKAASIWREALARLEPTLEAKEILGSVRCTPYAHNNL